MCVHLRTDFQVSSVILTSFRQGLISPLPPPPRPTAKGAPKKPILIRVNEYLSKIIFFNIEYIYNLAWNFYYFFVIFINLQLQEFAKSRAKCAIRASVVYVPTCPRANVPKACQLLIFTCQRATGVPIFPLRVATCPKGC